MPRHEQRSPTHAYLPAAGPHEVLQGRTLVREVARLGDSHAGAADRPHGWQQVRLVVKAAAGQPKHGAALENPRRTLMLRGLKCEKCLKCGHETSLVGYVDPPSDRQ